MAVIDGNLRLCRSTCLRLFDNVFGGARLSQCDNERRARRRVRCPPETIAAVRAELGALVDGIVAAVRAAQPDLRRGARRRRRGSALRLGIEQAIRAFLDAVERGERPARRDRRAVAAAGRGRVPGRAAAWRSCARRFAAGTRAAWRGAAEVGRRGPGSRRRRDRAGRGDLRLRRRAGHRRRRGLPADAVRRGRRARAPPPPAGRGSCSIPPARTPRRSPAPPSSRAGRCRARWRCWRSAGDDPAPLARRLDLDVLAGADGDGAWLVLPDPDGPGPPRRRSSGALGRRAGGARPDGRAGRRAPLAALGAARARRSRPARRASDGVARCAPPTTCPIVILLQDRELAARAGPRRAWRRSTPCPPASASGCIETLAAWLAHQRTPTERMVGGYGRGCREEGGTRRPSPRSSTSTRRPSATGSPSCASCSARPWRRPRGALSSRWRCASALALRLAERLGLRDVQRQADGAEVLSERREVDAALHGLGALP